MNLLTVMDRLFLGAGNNIKVQVEVSYRRQELNHVLIYKDLSRGLNEITFNAYYKDGKTANRRYYWDRGEPADFMRRTQVIGFSRRKTVGSNTLIIQALDPDR